MQIGDSAPLGAGAGFGDEKDCASKGVARPGVVRKARLRTWVCLQTSLQAPWPGAEELTTGLDALATDDDEVCALPSDLRPLFGVKQ